MKRYAIILDEDLNASPSHHKISGLYSNPDEARRQMVVPCRGCIPRSRAGYDATPVTHSRRNYRVRQTLPVTLPGQAYMLTRKTAGFGNQGGGA